MFLFLCSFSIVFWGCLDLFYFYLRFIKNFQIIREEFPFFSQFFTIHLTCGVVAIVRNPGGRHSQALVGYATLWLYLPSCRFAHGYCRGLALCVLVILLRFPSAVAVGSLCACWLFVYAFPGLRWARLDLLALCEGLLRPSPASHRVSS